MAQLTNNPDPAEWPALVMRDLARHLQRENLPETAEHLLDAALVFQRELSAKMADAEKQGPAPLRLIAQC